MIFHENRKEIKMKGLKMFINIELIIFVLSVPEPSGANP